MTDLSVEAIHASVFAEYQPIVDLDDGRIVACEALARWRSPDGTVASIQAVIDEIESVEDYATALTVRMLHCIREDFGGFLDDNPHFSVSINIPPNILGRERLGVALEECGLMRRIHQLTGEITERKALDDLGVSAIREARALGARVALDDFGTGNSGLQQLIGLEVDTIKIDRSFVMRLGQDRTAERLVRGITAFANILKVDLVAEGVETPEQASFLRAIGVEKGQGWLWSKSVEGAVLKAAVS